MIAAKTQGIALESDNSDYGALCPTRGVDGRAINSAFTRRELTAAFIARFQTKFHIDRGCWLWHAALYKNGYGQVCIGRHRDGTQHNTQAHRVAYVLAHDDIPAGKVVMHSCDIKACVNPAHLSLGTQHENIRDAVTRGHIKTGLKVGSVRWRAEQLRLGLRPDGRTRAGKEIAQLSR